MKINPKCRVEAYRTPLMCQCYFEWTCWKRLGRIYVHWL